MLEQLSDGRVSVGRFDQKDRGSVFRTHGLRSLLNAVSQSLCLHALHPGGAERPRTAGQPEVRCQESATHLLSKRDILPA